ncbi:MAG: PTS system mannose/fructose/sorbose family transporter subunit IID, partial [Halanaerobiales bacterium]
MPNTNNKEINNNDVTQEDNNDVTQEDVKKSLWRYILTFQWSWNYERMQALGFAWAIMPILKKVNKTRDDLIKAVQKHMQFFNTHPPLGGAIMGASVAMEEEGVGSETTNNMKVGLMGPMAGIGDTLYAVLSRPIIGVFAASLALAGNIMGFWIMVIFGVTWGLIIKYALFWVGYNQGTNLVTEMSGGNEQSRIEKVTEYATIFGITVIGGFIPDILDVTTPLKFQRTVEVQGEMTKKTVELQSVLDDILPSMIPILLVALVY